MKRMLCLIGTVILTGCGGGIDGTYKDAIGMTSYTFDSGGKVTVEAMGTASELEYRVEDGKVKIGSEQGSVVMKIIDEATLEGPMGLTLKKI